MKRPANLKSALALLLCFAMVLSFVPMQVSAATVAPIAAHDCAKDGHDYKAGTFRATCQQHPRTHYTCTYCGDSYDVYAEELYSDWQETKPDADEALIQTKTQYRTSQYETVTSYNSELDGYEKIGTQWSVIDTRSVAYVASWPAGFDTTNSLYNQYNKASMKVSASESDTRRTVIDSDEIVGYLYYHWCYEGHPYTVDTQSGKYTRFHAYYSTKSTDQANSYDSSDNSFRFDDATACADSKWYFYVPVYQQTYTNYRLEYIHGTWGNYSPWSDTEATASETLKVATRTVYRYVNAPLADHDYNTVTTAPTCSAAGKAEHTCGVCGYNYIEELPATAHSFANGKCTACGSAEPNYYLFGYINGANYACEEDYQNMGTYKFVDGKLTVTFEQDSYIGIKTQDNASWYMTQSYCTDDVGTFYNTNTGVGEKMFVPGGVEITFTLVYGEGDTLVLTRVGGGCTHNYEKTVTILPTCTEGGKASYACAKCGDSYTEDLEATGHDYRRGICKGCGLVDETYVTPNYYLVGYINGVDYGSQDDYENRGEFRFEGGKLVINCTQDSYVFVKTEGNTAWYMTSAYCTDTSATLYDTRDGSMEKMFIPAYMEVTFTLVETENNTLLLSYEAVPCKHIYDDSVSVEAGCEVDGIMLRTCRICTATAEKPIPAVGHNHKAVVTAPGCNTPGYTTYVCACGDSYTTDEVEAAGHDFAIEILEAPGCLTAGWGNYVCKVCGHSYAGTVKATGHDHKATVVEPTCDSYGYTYYFCVQCGDSYTDEHVPATGHHYKGVTTLAPTCVTDGIMTYTCPDCGDAYIQTMKATGHNYKSVVTKPTCTEQGYTTHSCAVCGYIYQDTYVAATGHKLVNGKCSVCGDSNSTAYYLFGWINGDNYACEGDWENLGEYKFVDGKLVTSFGSDSYIGIKSGDNASWYMLKEYSADTTATFYSSDANEKLFVPGGVELTFTLTVNKDGSLTLSYSEGESAICEHNYYYVVTKLPSCETSGVKTYTCNNCGISYTETVNAVGHSYKTVVTKPTCTAGGMTNHTCLICGDSYTDKIVPAAGHAIQSAITTKPGCETTGMATHRCKNCDYSYTTKIDATGHSYEAVVTDPTCDKAGYTTHTCAACGDSYKNTEVPAIGHRYTASVTKEPTCTEEGVMTFTCGNCGGSYDESLATVKHTFVEGACSVCGKSEVCEHTWEEGICKECGALCSHEYVYGICSICSDKDPFYVPSYYLVGYINGADYGCNDDYENMGDYLFQDDKLIVTFEQDSYVFLKSEGNANWYMVKEYTTETTATFYNTNSGASEKMFVPGGVELIFTLTTVNNDTMVLSYKPFACEHNYEVTSATPASCTEDGSVSYTCFECGDSYTEAVPATGHNYVDGNCEFCGAEDPDFVPDYYLIGFINGADYGCNDDYENMGAYKFVDGALIATFEQDSYVFLKSAGNANWYMAQAYSDGTAATTFYNTTTGASEKMFVPGGVELIFTLTINNDDTLVLSYKLNVCEHNYEITSETPASCTEDGSVTYTCAQCGESYTEAVPATGHSYVEGKCEHCGAEDPDFVPDYYLIGWINGADYGCNDDYENMGIYKFVDGKLTATFEQDSYVFLKTAGNANWYMAQSYSDGTAATTFYNTSTGASEKMFVPANVEVTFTLVVNDDDTVTVSYTKNTVASIVPTLTLKAPTLEFKDMITVNAMFTAENIEDVVEMGMITYTEKVDEWSVETANHVIPGTTYDVNTGRYIAASQGIHAKYLGDTVYLACYAKLTDGTYVYTKLAGYSPVQYATSKLKGTDVPLKQLVVAMLNYGAAAQVHFNHNVDNLANSTLTAEQIALPEAYRSDMVSTVASPDATKQGAFANNKGFSKRYPSISFEGAFCINYFFTPAYVPVGEITLYYWNAADFESAQVMTAENATGSIVMEIQSNGEYRADIAGIAAKALGEGVYVAATYTDGSNTWTSGVLGYSIGAYCSSQATKGGTIADLAMATAVYGYQAKQYFG